MGSAAVRAVVARWCVCKGTSGPRSGKVGSAFGLGLAAGSHCTLTNNVRADLIVGSKLLGWLGVVESEQHESVGSGDCIQRGVRASRAKECQRGTKCQRGTEPKVRDVCTS